MSVMKFIEALLLLLLPRSLVGLPPGSLSVFIPALLLSSKDDLSGTRMVLSIVCRKTAEG